MYGRTFLLLLRSISKYIVWLVGWLIARANLLGVQSVFGLGPVARVKKGSDRSGRHRTDDVGATTDSTSWYCYCYCWPPVNKPAAAPFVNLFLTLDFRDSRLHTPNPYMQLEEGKLELQLQLLR